MSDTEPIEPIEPDSIKPVVAALAGTVAAIHLAAKRLEASGIEEADMIACQVEDLFATLEPLLGDIGQAEALSRNG